MLTRLFLCFGFSTIFCIKKQQFWIRNNILHHSNLFYFVFLYSKLLILMLFILLKLDQRVFTNSGLTRWTSYSRVKRFMTRCWEPICPLLRINNQAKTLSAFHCRFQLPRGPSVGRQSIRIIQLVCHLHLSIANSPNSLKP